VSTTPTETFRRLLVDLPRGAPISTEVLTSKGIPGKAVVRLASDGWLHRLGRGVYLLPGDKLDRDATLGWLCERIQGLHVGGKTALDWRGVRHNISMRELLSLWGDVPAQMPRWFSSEFPCHYQSTQLFDTKLSSSSGMGPLPFGSAKVMVSAPERAVLELLSDAGKRQTLEETINLLENMHALRRDVLDELMAHLTRIKVARLADKLSANLQLPWNNIANKHSRRLGGGKRWVVRAKTGERIDLKGPSA
jgi:hypothetical protein